MFKKLLILYKAFCGKIISKNPSRFKLKINIKTKMNIKKNWFWKWKPHPTVSPNVFKKITVIAKTRKEVTIPAIVREQSNLILLSSSLAKLKNE